MSDSTPPRGAITWTDLTVADAPGIRDFYAAVAGWQAMDVPMGGYADYAMRTEEGTTVAGICHARGPNANVPAQWLVYIAVPDLAAALLAARAHGGEVIDGPRDAGSGLMAVLRDPAGAVFGLFAAHA